MIEGKAFKVDEDIDFVDILRRMRTDPYWQEFKVRVLEKRVLDSQLAALRPANSQEQMIECERAKGAAIALQGVLSLFDPNIPLPTTENSDED